METTIRMDSDHDDRWKRVQYWLLDTDGDGLPDSQEASLGTDPNNFDSDNDGASDGVEVSASTDPKNSSSIPADTDNDGLYDVEETSSGTGTDPTKS